MPKTKTAAEVKERPILFSTPMVKAILEGRKTQTRRILKANFHPDTFRVTLMDTTDGVIAIPRDDSDRMLGERVKCPYGKIGDRLWVRETWGDVTGAFQDADELRNVAFKADESVWNCYGQMVYLEQLYQSGIYVDKWRPSIFMPKFAARLWLEITNVRVERLQDISEADAQAEGCRNKSDVIGSEHVSGYWGNGQPSAYSRYAYKTTFQLLWYSINGQESWDANPFVWVIEFKKL
jgi:hypothetical protein